jgi:hypothetical protein
MVIPLDEVVITSWSPEKRLRIPPKAYHGLPWG